MIFHVDAASKSLNHVGEELCGDMVEIHHTDEFDLMILADGMGSGVKANILSSLTSKILATMFLKGAPLDECVHTVLRTLPICQVRQVAYSTFSILQVFKDGNAYLVEYDNPSCIFIRNGKLMPIPKNTTTIEGKEINEYRFQVQMDDCFILTSDGTIYAGVEQALNFGWTWEHLSAFAVKEYQYTKFASRLANRICQKCNELYGYRPGDDTTTAVLRITHTKLVKLITGPPKNKEDDWEMVQDFMDKPARRIVCGGSTGNMVARVINRPLTASLQYVDPKIPPIAHIDGIDLTTEGVLTLNRAVSIMKEYVECDDLPDSFFYELDAENGGAMLARMLIENCTDLEIYVGTATNEAHQNPDLPFNLNIRGHLIEQIKIYSEALGRRVSVKYY